MEKKSPPLPESKFKFLYFLPKAIISSEPSPRTPPHRMTTKKKKKKTEGSASMSVKNHGSFRFRGPRSPKVSCIGYVVNKDNEKKRKDEKKKKKNDSKGKEHLNVVAASSSNPSPLILKLLKVLKKKGSCEESSCSPPGAVHQKSVPKLGDVKKFYEWRRVHDSSAVAPDRPSSLSNKRKEKRNGAISVGIESIVLVPRKEINLWKKRMVAPPPPLRV